MSLLPRRAQTELPPEPTVESFEGFYAREYRAVLALVLALTGDRSLSEDLTQEGFMAVFADWERIQDPKAWIRVAVTNKSMSWWRRHYAWKRAMSRLAAPEEASDDATQAESF